ncbi:MAG: RNA polymerase sigma factor [Acidobacteriota bacterium]
MIAEPPSDEELMAAVRSGDPSGLTLLFERHGRRLFGYLRGLVGDVSAAEDLVQETFTRLLRHRSGYNPGRPFLPWMLTIARNAAWAHLRSRARHTETDLPVPDLAPSLEAQHIGHQHAEQLSQALHNLPAPDRDVLLLSYFEGLRHREIADVLGSTRGAVKVRIHRAIKALRRHFNAFEEPK